MESGEWVIGQGRREGEDIAIRNPQNEPPHPPFSISHFPFFIFQSSIRQTMNEKV